MIFQKEIKKVDEIIDDEVIHNTQFHELILERVPHDDEIELQQNKHDQDNILKLNYVYEKNTCTISNYDYYVILFF
jgi:rubrerythrin